jgi:polyphosphate kinase 2 (PPK2 family)
VDLARKLPRKAYKSELPDLQLRLARLAAQAREAGVSTVLLFEGWFGAGKGESIFDLTQWLDARGYKVHPIHRVATHGDAVPWLKRFALREPSRGTIALFDRSWYLRVLDDVMDGSVRKSDLPRLFRDIRWLERLWADSGIVLVKLFLHISKQEQRKRMRARDADPNARWYVDDQVRRQHERYGRYRKLVNQAVEGTTQPGATWTLVSAEDREQARVEVFRAVLAALETRLGVAPSAPAKTSRARKAKPAGKKPAAKKPAARGKR